MPYRMGRVNHPLLAELFCAAGDYHGALARYASVLRSGEDIESAAQAIIGASLRYRLAIDRVLSEDDAETLRMVASRSRLRRLRRVLSSTSRLYNVIKQ